MNAYLQRADDFIQQQIYKFEQKKQGREYTPMRRPAQQPPYPPRAQTFNTTTTTTTTNPPPQLPQGWTQEFDHHSQRYYYLEHSTGRSQWTPPPLPPSSPSFHPQHASTFNDASMARRLQQEEEQQRGRQSIQCDRQAAPHLGVPAAEHHGPVSTSPHPSPHGRLPPGAHLDMKTGQIVYNIYPRDHPINNM